MERNSEKQLEGSKQQREEYSKILSLVALKQGGSAILKTTFIEPKKIYKFKSIIVKQKNQKSGKLRKPPRKKNRKANGIWERRLKGQFRRSNLGVVAVPARKRKQGRSNEMIQEKLS